MKNVRVAIIDDDLFRATGMELLLRNSAGIEVVLAIGQDAALQLGAEVWQGVDVALVEVFDEISPGEVGTDAFSGIAAIEHIKFHGVRSVAIIPHRSNALIDLRIVQAGTDFAYRSYELQSVAQLEAAILSPGLDRRPLAPSPEVLDGLGARRARPNESIREYQRSSLHGLVQPDTELGDLPVHRNTLSKFRQRIRRTGFTGTEQRGGQVRAPRWPDVRSYLLRALGRDPGG